MSFLDEYLSKGTLGEVSTKVKDTLSQLEQKLSDQTASSGGNFDDCVQVFGPQMMDLATRLKGRLSSISVHSLSEAWDLLKFAKNIGFEVYQIIENVKGCVFKDGLTGDAAKQRELAFGKDLAYFVWLSVSPLEGKLTWVPFKKTIEEKLVKWIAGMAIQLAEDVLNKTVNKAESGDTIVKAL